MSCLRPLIKSRVSFRPIIHNVFIRPHHPAQFPMPMRQEPPANSQRYPAQNQQLIPHDQRRQNHQRQTGIKDICYTMPGFMMSPGG